MFLSSLLNVANILRSAHFTLGIIGLIGLHRDFSVIILLPHVIDQSVCHIKVARLKI